MSSLRWNDEAALPSRQARDRFRLRRRRTAAGPLRTLPKRRRGGGSWVVSFALFSTAVLAVAVTVVGFSDRYAATPAQSENGPAAQAPRRVTAAPAAVAAAAEPAPVVRREAALPPESRPAPVTPSIDRAAEPAAPVARTRPTAEASPFALDQLPVLDVGTGLESDDGASLAAPPARPAKASARRSGVPAQH